MRYALLVIGLLFLTTPAFSQGKLNGSVGMVQSRPDKLPCLAIRDADLKPGRRVFVVMPDRPQSILKTRIGDKIDSCNSTGDDEKSSFYELKMKITDPFVAIGLLNGARLRRTRGIVSGDLNRDGKRERFRICWSNEGAHLTVWAGTPLKAKRLWHGYYYAGYDTQPNCTKKDY